MTPTRAPETLAGDGVWLRRYQHQDATGVHQAADESAAEVAPYETWCHQGYTPAEAAEYVAGWVAAWDAGRAYYYAVVDPAGGRFLGSCGLCPIEWAHGTAGLGFWVRTSQTGRGLATAAARLVSEAAFGLGLHRVELLIATANAPSRRVAEKLGAAYEGTLRRRLTLPSGPTDMAMYSLLR